MTDRVTIRLGPLYGPVAQSATENGLTLSQEVRRRLAASCGLTEPVLKRGPKPQGESKVTATQMPGTHAWCHEDGRVQARLGSLLVFMSPQDIAAWNAGSFDGDPMEIRCHVATTLPGRSYVRNGEVVTTVGLPTNWYGTIGQAVSLHLIDQQSLDDAMDCAATVE